jgi:hypothetical protein
MAWAEDQILSAGSGHSRNPATAALLDVFTGWASGDVASFNRGVHDYQRLLAD